MFNSRDSYSNMERNKSGCIEVPYEIGTIIELNNNPDVIARICQYRIIVKKYRLVINVGLNTNVFEEKSSVDCEITLEELQAKWKKTDRIIIGNLNSEDFLLRPRFSEKENELKLKIK